MNDVNSAQPIVMPPPPGERIVRVEGQVASIVDALDEHGERISALESSITDVKMGLGKLHGDLALNNQVTGQISQRVDAIGSDVKDIVAMYRATPRMAGAVRYVAWAVGAVCTLVITVATVVAAIK